ISIAGFALFIPADFPAPSRALFRRLATSIDLTARLIRYFVFISVARLFCPSLWISLLHFDARTAHIN
ncbi:MAG TPA: hypothetical protein VMR54_02890, partial [Thermoanaerobaculia bacterium]|nr:hypothetical protein [Thermoanaerobaculia bacterium]